MPSLKHDSSGFLVGEAINPLELAAAIDLLEQIRDDLAAIKGVVSNPGSTETGVGYASPVAASSAIGLEKVLADVSAELLHPRPQSVATPNYISSVSNTFAESASNQVALPIPLRDKSPALQGGLNPAAVRLEAVVLPNAQARGEFAHALRERDASGRFVGKRGGASGNDGADSISDSFSSVDTAKRIGEAVAEATGGADEVDPTIKAFNEIAAPVGKVVGVVRSSGRREEKERRFWFRRIWRELFSFRKEETAYSRASIRVLKDIEKKPENSGGGPLTMIFSLLSKIPLIGGLLAGSLFGGALSGVLGGLASGGKGLLKRIPLLGAILSSAGGLFDIYNSETDANLSRQEKDVRTGKGAGKLAGSLGGLWAGAKLGAAMGAVGGPLGAAIGGVVGGAAGVFFGDKAGKVIGETVGGWVAELRSADPVGYIKEKWESITSKVSFIWESATTSISERWSAATTAFTNTFNAVMTGVFGEKWAAIADAISAKWHSITDSISTKWDALIQTLSDKWTEAVDGIKEFFGGVVDSAKEKLSQANDYIKDKTGVDVAETARAAGEKASNAVDWMAEKTDSAKGWLKESWQALTGTAGNPQGVAPSTGAKLPRGYRGKHRFDGIAGGEGLARDGSYTEAEARKIRELKRSGVNTSANLKGGMPAEIQQKIRASAEAHGLDPEMMLSIAAMESGGNPNAISETGATGVYQFVGSTATGIGIEDRFDANQNIDGAMRLTLQNVAVLEKHGLPLTLENIYMAHQLGPSAAIDLIKGAQSGKTVGELKGSTRSGMDKNYGSNSSTAEEYLARNQQALTSRYEYVVARSDAGILPTTTVLADAGAVDPSKGAAVAANQSVASSTDSSLGVVNQGLLAPTVAPVSHNAAANPSFFAQAFVAPVQPAVTAYMPTVKAPSAVVAAPPPVEAAPPMRTQLSSGRKDVQQLTVAAPDAGQDVRDRTIAHIVTGGLSG